ncbi:MAG: response regulator, partial [Rhodospirillales bacterium]
MKAHILIVEDDPSLSELLAYNFDSAGFKASIVSEGDEALPTILDELPDLVILDWMLPNLSGIEICRQIRQHPDIKKTPIIMLTAKGEEAERIRGLETGADDYVIKPFSPSELIARIKAVLRRTHPE